MSRWPWIGHFSFTYHPPSSSRLFSTTPLCPSWTERESNVPPSFQSHTFYLFFRLKWSLIPSCKIRDNDKVPIFIPRSPPSLKGRRPYEFVVDIPWRTCPLDEPTTWVSENLRVGSIQMINFQRKLCCMKILFWRCLSCSLFQTLEFTLFYLVSTPVHVTEHGH